jgi:hypothetical protein
MTREKALEVNRLLVKIESYETLIDEIRSLEALDDICIDRGESDLEDELVAVVQARLDKALKELEEL